MAIIHLTDFFRKERSKIWEKGSSNTVPISPANTAHATRFSRSTIRSIYSAVETLTLAFIRISRNRSHRSVGGESSVISTARSSTCLAISGIVDSKMWKDMSLHSPPCRRDRARVVITCLGSPAPIRNAANGRSPGSASSRASHDEPTASRAALATAWRSSDGLAPQKLCK